MIVFQKIRIKVKKIPASEQKMGPGRKRGIRGKRGKRGKYFPRVPRFPPIPRFRFLIFLENVQEESKPGNQSN